MKKQHNKNKLSTWILRFIFFLIFSNVMVLTDIEAQIKPDTIAKTRIEENYGKLPLTFEANQGQTDKNVQFIARGQGYGLFLTPTEAVLSLHKSEPTETKTLKLASPTPSTSVKKQPTRAVQSSLDKTTTLRMKLVGGNRNPQITGLDELPGKVNYFRGKDPKQWQTNIPTYAKAKYEKVYPGIDLVYYGNQRQLEYDFIVAPGADPKAVQLAFEGADELSIDKQGDLVLKSAGGDIRLRKPRAYQDINGQKREIDGRYVLHTAKSHEKGIAGFQVAAYDKNKPLVIDPVLVYSTYLGGSNSEALCGYSMGIAVDALGNAYIAGSTASMDFPTTAGAFDTTHNPYGDSNYTDAFVAKLNAEGSALLYATYLGGATQASTCGVDIAVDTQGNSYITGSTGAGIWNIDFPTTIGAFDTEYGPNSRIEYDDGFVTKIDKTGSTLVYSTFLGGNRGDNPAGIAVDSQGNAYVTGGTDSETFPTTPGAFDTTPRGYGQSDAYVVKLNPMGTSLIYGTHLGGNGWDWGNAIAVDNLGNVFVAGRNGSSDFPITPGAFDISPKGGFITKLNETGSALVYSTFLGGSSGGNELFGIRLDGIGNAYVIGTTNQADFPTTPGAFDISFNGTSGGDVTVSKLNASGNALVYSTYLGGSLDDKGSAISVDTAGNAAVTGYTCSIDFPTQNPLQATNAGDCDGFVAKFDSAGSSLIFATYLGGSIGFPGQSAYDSGSSIAMDGVGNVYVTGITASSNFPTTMGALQTSNNGNIDTFVAKISDSSPTQPVLFNSPTSLSFNSITLGMRKDLEFTVKNTGGGTLTGSAKTSSPFSIVSGGSFSLSAGASQTVTVRFSTETTGLFNGNVSITTNGGNSSVMVSGTGSVPTTTTNYGVNVTSGSFAEPVNTATGNYFYQHTDLSMTGRGLTLMFTRTLNVQDASTGPFGPGWTHSYNLKLTENGDGSVVIKMGDGHDEFYDPTGGGAYQAHDPGVFNTLMKNNDGSFALTRKDQSRMAFTATGRLLTISDRNGNSLGFAYNGEGNISTITDTVGRIVTFSYNADNHLSSITDPLGRIVTYGYDANGRLISDTDSNGDVMRYHYNTSGLMDLSADRRGHTLVANTYDGNKRVVSQTNGKGAVTQFAYDTPTTGKTAMTDARGGVTIHTHDILRRLVQETDPLGHSVSTVYDAYNNRTGITDKNGNVTKFTYDSFGNVLSKTDAQGKVTTLEYNTLNDPTRIVDALGQITAFAYDAKGNLNEVTDAFGHKTKVTYDASGQPASVTDARGGVTLNTFNTQGNLIQVEDALGHKTRLSYDVIGRRTGMTDANGHAASFSYDNNGNLVSVTDPLSHKTTFTYDANNNRTGVTDPRGNATAFVYDANDLLSKATDPLGNFVQFAYDAADNRTAVTDPRGNITQYAYDAANRLTQVTDALSHATTLAYDANGNLLTQTNPLGHTRSFAYDELNRLLNATDALGNKGYRSYDALGRLTLAKDAQGRITQYAYDTLGRLTKVTDAKSGTVVYDYDALGNRLAVTDPNGHTTGYSYDALNRLTAKTDPLGQAYSYSYDPVGNRISLTDAKGQNLLYNYDDNNRLAAIAYPDNTQVSFSYDAAGNRTKMIDKLGTSTYAFDALNRLDAYTDAFGKTVANEFDKAGNRTALIYPDGKRVTYGYDVLNRMATVTDWLNGVTNYSYDAANKLAAVLNPNNTQVSYGYDAAERLVNLANAKADTSVLASYALTLDAVGNRSGINRSEPLAPVFSNKTQALTFDNDNRLLTLDAATVTNDPNGNLTAEPGKSFQYDFEDRLVGTTGDQSAEFSYDGVGNRLAATRNGQTTRYTLDVSSTMANVLVENDGAGTPTAYYVHGLGLISRITPSGEARYYHYDTIGSTVALTDAAGNVTDSYTYDPFGQVLNTQGSSINPFQYVGQFGVMQEGNGLQFMRARYYEGGAGRFMNKDPISGSVLNAQAQNRFAYALNNPLRFIDFMGLYAKETTSNHEVLGYASQPNIKQTAQIEFKEPSVPILNPNGVVEVKPTLIKRYIEPVKTIFQTVFWMGAAWLTNGASEIIHGGTGNIEEGAVLEEIIDTTSPPMKDVMHRAKTGQQQTGYAGTQYVISKVSRNCKKLADNRNASEQYLDCVLGSSNP